MRVAIIGCGQISRAHITAIQRIGDIEISAVCDRDTWRARETADFVSGIKAYGDFAELLGVECPEVVHVLTPPDTHAALAIQAMEAGCHVLVEKPMALGVQEADRMIVAAQENGVKLCADHNYLFKPSVAKAERLVKSGAIGKVVYVDSYYGLYGEASGYMSAAGGSHWAWRLPGGVFTNFLPHLIYLQLLFLPQVDCVSGVTLIPRDAGRRDPPTEMTILLQGSSASGIMTVSMRAKPYAKFVDIYGTKGIIHTDLVRELCTIHAERHVPRMVSKAIFSLEDSVQLASGTLVNTARVALGSMKNMPGLQVLMREFYNSLWNDREPPVTGEAGRRVAEIMEMIWAKCPERIFRPRGLPEAHGFQRPETDAERALAKHRKALGKVLVTGATGFLGHHLASALARCGADVVALVRDKNRVSPELEQQATLVCGDLRDTGSIESAMRDVDVVYHCAAVTTNAATWASHYDTNVRGTGTLLEKALEAGVKRVLHVSSVIVYGLEGRRDRSLVRESDPCTQNSDRWSHYMRSKIAADQLALRFSQEKGLPVTVLRLGILYGPGGGRLPGHGLLQLGSVRFLIGNGHNPLPYTYVGNAVDCLLLASICPQAIGEVYNVVDEPQVSVRDAVSNIVGITGEPMNIVPVPYILVYAAARLAELKKVLSGASVPPRLSAYVVRSACREIRYDTSKARQQLGWRPEMTLEGGLRKTLEVML